MLPPSDGVFLGAVNLSEFIKMVLAGVAAATPHMQSAAIISLACIL